jgi:two-component system chemotaxis response regulator CheB
MPNGPAYGGARAERAGDPTSPPRPIRVLLVDDSLVARTVLARLLEANDAFEVAGSLPAADQAIAFLGREQADIIVLDVEMPGKDGLTALPEILAAARGARVIIVSSSAEAGASATVRALTLGAADTLLKPTAGNFAGEFARQFIDRLLRLGHATLGRAGAETSRGICETIRRTDSPPAVIALRPVAGGPIGCLALGASTGGLHALSAFLRRLNTSFTAPILITQHLPPVFMPYFAAQLRDIANRPTRVATEGTPLVPGGMLVAPGEGHIRLVRQGAHVRVKLDNIPAPSRCMPSVDPMFEAVAEVFGAAGCGVVLTGMGRDGTIGARALAAADGEVLAQDAGTSVVWGMPGSVAREGLASAVLSPELLAERVNQRGSVAWN